MPAIDGPSVVTLVDQLGQRLQVTIYTPVQWRAVPTEERISPWSWTTDRAFVVTLSDAAPDRPQA